MLVCAPAFFNSRSLSFWRRQLFSSVIYDASRIFLFLAMLGRARSAPVFSPPQCRTGPGQRVRCISSSWDRRQEIGRFPFFRAPLFFFRTLRWIHLVRPPPCHCPRAAPRRLQAYVLFSFASSALGQLGKSVSQPTGSRVSIPEDRIFLRAILRRIASASSAVLDAAPPSRLDRWTESLRHSFFSCRPLLALALPNRP